MDLQVNGLNLHVIDEGEGPAVLLLHGWPDSADLWREQVPALVEAGFRVVAPDQRGFGRSDKPVGVENYAIPLAVMDAVGILDALGIERAAVVGHDWGATVAWFLAGLAPDRVERLVAVSVGHPSSFFSTGMRQRQLSWYMLFFQAEGVAEEALAADDFAFFREFVGPVDDLDRYVADLSRPGALTASLSWYRANISAEFFGVPGALELPIACPTMGVWSTGDFALSEEQMTASAAHVSGPWRYERLDAPDHWVPRCAADQLNTLLLDFLGS